MTRRVLRLALNAVLPLCLILTLTGFSADTFSGAFTGTFTGTFTDELHSGGTAIGAASTAIGAASTASFAAAVLPYVSCPSSKTYDVSSGRCKTPRTSTRPRSYSCPSGWVRGSGQYGSYVCRRSFSSRVQTGTEQVFSHYTYKNVWVNTGSRRVLVRTERKWVPPRSYLEPLVPPVKVAAGSTRQQRCSYDPFAGQLCWYEQVTTYRWISTRTVTIPGYYGAVPIYEYVPTGFWKKVSTSHYINRPVYETQTTWRTQSASPESCPSGWSSRGHLCQRSWLGEPSSAPQLRCPSTMRLVASGFGGGSPQCVPVVQPSEDIATDSPDSQPDGPEAGPEAGTGPAGPEAGPDPASTDTAAELGSRLAALGDDELADLGLTRCENGLLSYVDCDVLPDREWEQDQNSCDGIPGTRFSEAHGGSCVTKSDSLVKCTTPSSCNQVSIRTYCPAISGLSTTEIRQQVSSRGAESYRVCVFVCDSFGSLPVYVRERILQSPDYACADVKAGPTTTAPSTTGPTTTAPPTTGPPTTAPTTTVPTTTAPTTTGPTSTAPPVGTTVPKTTVPKSTVPSTTVSTVSEPPCVAPARADIPSAAQVGFASPLKVLNAARSPQQHLPGAGEYLVVAPGEGWLAAMASPRGSPASQSSASQNLASQSPASQDQFSITDSADCVWQAQSAQVSWRELVPWNPADRSQMSQPDPSLPGRAPHLVQQWDALSPIDQTIVRLRHRSAVKQATTTCAIEALISSATQSCAWRLLQPAVFEWSIKLKYATKQHNETVDLTLASGFEWVRSLGTYSSDTVAFAGFAFNGAAL